MSFFSFRRFFVPTLPRDRRINQRPRRTVRRHLTVETLEQRLAPASLQDVLPAAIVSGQQILTPPPVTGLPLPANMNPQVAVDPVNPSTVFEVHSTGTGLAGFISNDNGSHWNPVPIGMPPSDGLAVTDVSGVSIGIDRHEQAYVVFSFHSTDNSIGVIELARFDVSGGMPVQTLHTGTAQGGTANTITLDGSASGADNAYQGDVVSITGGTGFGESLFITSYSGGSKVATVNAPWPTIPDGSSTFAITSPTPYQVLYSWNGTTPAYNPTVIVDNNVPNYVDPTTGAQTTDSMSGKAVFVTWNTDTSVELTGSTDGGLSFSTIQTVADGTMTAADGGNHPRGFITQGTPTNPGGILKLLYDKPTESDNTSRIALVQSRPDVGVVSQSPLPDTFLEQDYNSTTGAITEADPGVPKTTQFFFNITPDMFPAKFDLVANLDVVLGIVHPDVRELSVVLKSPVLDSVTHVPIVITLFNNSLDTGGNSTGVGIPGLNGFVNLGAEAGTFPGTVFDNLTALRSIIDPSNQAPFIDSFQPEVGSLKVFNNLSPLQLSGQWELDITDNRADPATTQYLGRWGFRFTPQSITSGPMFGPETTVASGLLPSSQTETYTTALLAAGTPGIGPNFVAAVDNTLGGFSPNQGTMYVAYTGPGAGADAIANGDGDVFLVRSTDGGASWSTPLRINNDQGSDGFSEGNRAQFQPELAVDPVTGTLVATWYDARYDASNLRPANFLATSIDGGVTFSPQQVFLNMQNTALDAITNQQRIIEPVPSNGPLTGTLGFGDRQGLAVWGGHVYPFWSGNINTDVSGEGIFTSNVTVAAGPRILQGDQGPIGQGGSTDPAITSVAADGTPVLTGFRVTFDRPVDPTTFGTDQVQLHYHKPSDPAGTFTDLSGQVTAVQALDAGAFGATQFLVSITPQSAVGDYSYAVGPNIQDRIRTLSQSGTAMDQDQNAIPGEPNFSGNGAASGDLFAIPAPADNTTPAFQTPYDTTTLPLIIPGPHVVATSTPGVPPTSDNLTVNGSVSSIDVVFDRDMNPATFTGANVLRLVGPYGTITGPFTVTADPSGTPPALAKRTFRIGFPTQTLSGNYSVVFAPVVQGVQVQDVNGFGMDTNLNAGLDTLRGFSVVPSVGAPITYTQSNPTIIHGVSTTKSTLTINDQFLIQQDSINHIQLRLNIAQAGGGPINDPDLTAKLISPNGKVVVNLFSNVGSTGSPPHSGFTDTVFDDFSTSPIQQGTAPFVLGPYTPQTPLSQIKGLSAKGTWTLSITNKGGTIGQITDWSLILPPPVLNDGLAEPIADQGTAGFRIFTQDPTNPQSQSQWTPVGPNPLNVNGNQGNVSGPVTAIALDPTDPSGNTAYAGAATGGVWKTTNFLNPAGPTWVPLTDFGPTGSMRIGGITVVPVNNNPSQSMIFVSTGAEQDGTTGVGLLRSMDAGRTWRLLDSLDNTVPFAQRTHDFVGLTSSKVIFDPKLLGNGKFAIYAAFGGGGNSGVYRSLNDGDTWQLIRAGDATDIVLAAGSKGSGGGNLTILYAAFRGDAVYRTTSALTAVSMDKLPGTDGFPSRRNIDTSPDTEVTITAGAAPSSGSPILLAAPGLMNQPLEDTNYQGWLYALGGGDALYVTKDFGHDWTKVNIAINNGFPTDDETRPQYNPTAGNATSFAIDPNDPNVVYIGGLANASASSGIIRVDLSKLEDAHAMVQYDDSNNDGGRVRDPNNLTGTFDRDSTTGPGTLNYGILTSLNQNYFNIEFDPINPFLTPSSLPFTGITNFRNAGQGVTWMPVDQSFTQGSLLIHKMVAVPDQLTGKTRLIVADNEGIFTAAVNADGSLFTNAGSDQLVTGNRNGNMQTLRFGLGASQYGELAAEIQGALFYGMAIDNHGFPTSDPAILRNGDINWTPDPAFPLGQGTGVATDPAGSGQVFEYRWPCCGAAPLPSDFFQYQRPGQTGFISRITGLLRTGVDNPATGAGQWPSADGSDFVVNPVDPTAIIMSAKVGGNIYRTSGPLTGTGIQWFEIAGTEANVQLDGSYAPGLAFGSPNPNVPGVLSDFIYAGTTAGNIWLTTTGGTSWSEFTTANGLDGNPIKAIVADPHAGFDDAYAITASHVYYIQHSTNLYAPVSPIWIDITGNLFSLTAHMFNDPTQASVVRLQVINTMVADWRFSRPNQIDNGTHPVLYVGGLGGVFRSDDQGQHWRFFPDVAHEGAVADGGLLPNINITNLQLALGSIDQSSGLPQQAKGYNLLLAMTRGRGAFAIRLDQDLSKTNIPISGPMVSSIANISDSNSEAIQVTFARMVSGVLTPTPVDPSTFTAADVVLKDPNGAVIPVRQVIDVTPVAANGTSQHNIYKLVFDNPVAGTYTVSIGPKISDFTGDLMDQNNNGVNGETFADIFHGTVSITPAARPTVGLPYADGFAGNYGDSLARQWLETTGRFQIQTTSAGNEAVALASGTNTAILQLATGQANVTVQADVNVTTTVGAQAGVIARYVDANNFYFGDIENSAGSYVAKIYRMFGGTLQMLNSAAISSASGTLRMEVVDGSIKLFLNDTLLTYAFDNLITAAGKIGIRGTQGTSFANFSADAFDPLTASIPFNENFNVPGPGSQLDRFWIDQFGNTADVNGQAQGEAAFNLSTVNGLNLTDVSVEADVALGSGQSAGLVARYSGPFYNNFYLAQFKDIGGGQFRAALFSNIGSSFNTLDVGSAVNTGTGHLQFEVVGPSLRLLFNGVLVAFADDLNLTSGSVGVRLPAGVSLDNFTVNTITPISATLPFNDDFSTSSAGSQLDLAWTNQLGDIAVSNAQAVGTGAFNLATVNGISQGDVKVTATIAPGSGQTVGLLARYGGPGYSNFYLGQLRDIGGGQFQAAIFANNGGTFTTLAVGSTISSPSGTLEFEVVGSSLKLIMGTTLVAYVQDTSITAPGSVGMRLGQGVTLDNFAASAVTVPTSQTLPFQETPNFASGDGSQLTTNWSDQLGNITVVSGNATGEGAFNLSTVNGLSIGDTQVKANVVVASGGSAALAARYAGPLYNNFYMGQLRNMGGGQFQAAIFKNIGGTFTTIAVGTTTANTGTGILEFEVAGSSLKVIFNGTLLAFGFDTSLTAAGSAGMRLSQGSTASTFFADQIPTPSSQMLPFKDDFSSPGDGNQLSTNWRDQNGNITVVAGVPNNLATGEGDFNLSTVLGINSTNITVAGDVNLTPGAGQSVGLVARYTGPLYSNFYFAQLRDIGGGQYQSAIFKNVGGTFSLVKLGSTTTKNAGRLKFILTGSSLELDLDSTILATVTDTSITGSGSVGMRLNTNATMGNFSAQ